MNRYLSLRHKMAALIAVGGLITAIIAAAGFTWLDLKRFRQSSQAQVQAIAGIVADQVGPAITLGDRQSAAEMLTALRSAALIRDAALYDENGNCFAVVNSAAGNCPPPARDGLHEQAGGLVMARPILSGGERVGTLVLAAHVPSVPDILRQYAGGAALIVVLSLVVAGLLAIMLQASVSTPILQVAGVARRIAETHMFEDRVAVASHDELGVLAASFNSMLGEIQRRDAELDQQRRNLLAEISDRIAMNAELRQAKERAEEATRLKPASINKGSN